MQSDLSSRDAGQRTLTFFALGGSGARTLEPLLYLCALGLGPRVLRVLIIDPDQSNAAISRSRAVLDTYRRIRAAIGAPDDGYFRTEVVNAADPLLVWSPISDGDHAAEGMFERRVDRSLMIGGATDLGLLFDALYSKRVRQMDLNLGFRGVPSIGTIFMNRLRQESFFEQILLQARTEAASTYFAVGSIFGGTGAAGLPVLGRALVDGLRGRRDKQVAGVEARRVGAALLTPYFTLPTPTSPLAADGGPRPEAALFAQNTAAALPSYFDGEAGYGGYYVLGDSEPREQGANEVGGAAQANAAHYVEFMAALAALDFSARGGEDARQRLPLFRSTTLDGTNVKWEDLPMMEASRARLMGGVIAMHAFLTTLRPDGRSHPDLGRMVKGMTWLEELGMTPKELEDRSAMLDGIGELFMNAWRWIGELASSSPRCAFVKNWEARPSELSHHALLAGRRSSHGNRRATVEGGEVFRYWNLAASQKRGSKASGLLPTIREGSERFLRDYFADTVND